MAIGKNIEKLLKEKGMTVTKLAAATGIRQSTLFMAIQRDSSKMQTEFLEKIAEVLDVETRDLIGIASDDKIQTTNIATELNDTCINESKRHIPETVSEFQLREKKENFLYWRDVLNPFLKLLGYSGHHLFCIDRKYTVILQQDGIDTWEIPLEDIQKLFSDCLDVSNFLLKKSRKKLKLKTGEQLEELKNSSPATLNFNEKLAQLNKQIKDVQNKPSKISSIDELP